MLLGVLILVVSIFFGFSIVSFARLFDSFSARLVVGIPLGIASVSFVEFALYASLGTVTTTSILIALVVLLSVAALCYVVSGSKPRKFFYTKHLLFDMPRSVQLGTLLVFIVISIVFIYSLSQSGGNIYCIDAGCSDIAYHIAIGNSLVYHAFPPTYPFVPSTPNVYPFMSDFFSMMLANNGLSLVPSILVPDILLIFSMVSASAMLAHRILKNAFGTISSMLVFWFGGNGIVQFIEYPFRVQLTPFFQPAHLLYVNGASAGLGGLFNTFFSTTSEFITFWVPIINTMLIAQRDFILGLPFGIAITLLLWDLAEEKGTKSKASRKTMVLAGVMIGMLPLIHPPTFVVVALFGAFMIGYSLLERKKKNVTRWLFGVLPAAALAIPQLLFMFSASRRSGFFTFDNSFIVNSPNIIVSVLNSTIFSLFFWTQVTGIAFILGILGFVLAPRKMKLFALPFLVLVIIIMFFRFLPDPANSNKFYAYSFLLLSVLSSYVLMLLWRRGMVFRAIAIVLLLLMTFNYAFIFFVHDVAGLQLLFSAGEVSASNYIINNTSPSSVFAVNYYRVFNPPVPSIGARTTLLSDIIYSEGAYTGSLGALVAANNGIIASGNCTLIRRYNVSYVYLQGTQNDTVAFRNLNFSLAYSVNDTSRGNQIYIFRSLC